MIKADGNQSKNEDWIRSLFEDIESKNTGENNAVDEEALNRFLDERYEEVKCRDALAIRLAEEIGESSKSGQIDYESFRRYIHDTENILRGSFSGLDQKRDNRLDLDEIKTGFEKLGIDIDESKLAQFFNSMDEDQDGYISYDEWRDRLLFIPNQYLVDSPLGAAYLLFIDDMDLSSEGDVLLSSETTNGVGYFLSGGLAGVVSRTATAPFDRIKVFLIATSGTPLKQTTVMENGVEKIITEQRPTSIIGAVKHLWKQGGPRAFFVGNGLNIVKVFPESAMKFGSFEAAKRFLCQVEGVQDTSELSRASTFLAGGLGGMAAQLTVYPIDTLKFRIQCSAQFSKLRGFPLLIHTLKKTYNDGGIRMFYRGLYVGVLGIFPFAALDLGTFSAMKKAYVTSQARTLNLDESEIKLGNMAVLTMGALSGSVGASVVYPVNLLRTRLQAQGTAGHPYTYNGFMDVFRKTVERDGYKGLFRGLAPNLAKVAPAVSISYLVYEKAKATLHLE